MSKRSSAVPARLPAHARRAPLVAAKALQGFFQIAFRGNFADHVVGKLGVIAVVPDDGGDAGENGVNLLVGHEDAEGEQADPGVRSEE